MPALRTVTSDSLRPAEIARLHDLFQAAWNHKSGVFTAEDEAHAFGGLHVLMEEHGEIVAHAAVVPRALQVSGRPLAAAYLEAVATMPSHQGRGYGTAVMRAVGEHLDSAFELGALSTGIAGFYERLGWAVWRGPTFCRTSSGLVRTQDEDGGILVLLTPATADLDLWAPISCPERSGDVW